MKVINAGDSLEFLSGGFYKATIHRVVQPPEDQQAYARLGAYYFCLPDDNIKLVPYEKESPVLKRFDVKRRFEDKDAPTVEQWRKWRTAAYGQTDLKDSAERGVQEEVINGVVVKHYT
jgi:isopenicillin N synthase-like dioxygenase